MKIGVLALQGDFAEHQATMRKLNIETIQVRLPGDLDGLDGLIIPGGESTTISKLIEKNGLYDTLQKKPIFGTCDGLDLLAKKGDGQMEQTGQRLLGRMDFTVNRNAFGRQRESFQKQIDFDGNPFSGVFIRAPAIEKVWNDCSVLSQLDGRIVAAEQGNCLATAFHPELTDDTRIHEYFIQKIRSRH